MIFQRNCFIIFILFPAVLTARDDADIPIISVLDITINNISEGDMQSIITLMSSALFRTDRFTVIDVSQRAAILVEMEFSNSGCSDESCQLEIGKLLSAEMIVVGDIAKVGSRFLITAKLLETETGKTLVTADGIYASMDKLIDDLFPLAERLAAEEEAAVIAEETAAEETAVETEPEPEPVSISEETPEATESETGRIDGRKYSPRKIASWSTLAGGAVATGMGGYFIYDAVKFNNDEVIPSYEDYENAIQGSDFDALRDIYLDNNDELKTKAILGGAVTGGGLIFLGASAWLFLMPEKVTDNVAAVFYTDPAEQVVTLSFHMSY